jgi:hypothetical protein
MPLPPPPAPEGRIGYYTPEGQWIVPNKTESNSTVSTSLLQLLSEESNEVEISSKSDPIYSSAWVPKLKKEKFPMDYAVPDFGLDHEIKES